ncbi:MAG: fimbrillin family protein [Rikenellaceae bacterium]
MKKLLTLLTTAMLFSACEKSPDEVGETASQITFKSSIASATRVVSDVFEDGDKISVTAFDGSTTYADQVGYVYDGSTFSSSSPIYYANETQELSFIAAYPAVDNFSNLFSFSVLADQSSGDNFEMSDLLVATTEATSNLNPTLEFSHAMSNLVINITDSSIADGVLKVFALGEASIDLQEGRYTASGETMELTAAKSGESSFAVLFAPQTINAGETVATYEVEGKTLTWVANNDLEFASGYRYTFNWDISLDKVTYSGNIASWNYESLNEEGYTESHSLDYFSATSYPISTDIWTISDSSATTDDFAGLSAAIEALAGSGREISLIFSNLTAIPDFAIFGTSSFSDTYNSTALVSVSAPLAESVGQYAFYNCSALVELDFPVATTIYTFAFAYCASLPELYFPSVAILENHCFRNCTSLTTANFPEATNVRTYIFFSCSSLTDLSLATNDGVELLEMTNISFGWNTATSITLSKINLTVGSANADNVVGNTIYVGIYDFTFVSITVL